MSPCDSVVIVLRHKNYISLHFTSLKARGRVVNFTSLHLTSLEVPGTINSLHFTSLALFSVNISLHFTSQRNLSEFPPLTNLLVNKFHYYTNFIGY